MSEAASTPYDPIAACAEQVAKGDPDRFMATMTGSIEDRKRLFPLYAFNLEIARAPYMSQEPMVAMIRLQFWRDVIEAAVEGNEAPRHDVATPLSQLLIWGDMRSAPLLRMIDAREGDVQGAPASTHEAILSYLRETTGALMLAACQLCGGADFSGDFEQDQAFEDVGMAQGLANWLMAQPALQQAGRGHVVPEADVIEALCTDGLARLDRAHARLGARGNAALRAAWRSKRLLSEARKHPGRVQAGELGEAEILRRGRLLGLSLFGRW